MTTTHQTTTTNAPPHTTSLAAAIHVSLSTPIPTPKLETPFNRSILTFPPHPYPPGLRLPPHHKIHKRPLPHPPIASGLAGPAVAKCVYVSRSTPLMAVVKRVRKLLAEGEKVRRGMGGIGGGMGGKRKRRLDGDGGALIEETERGQRKKRIKEEVLVKATGRAIDQALKVADWFKRHAEDVVEQGWLVDVRTAKVKVVDDIVLEGGFEEMEDDQKMMKVVGGDGAGAGKDGETDRGSEEKQGQDSKRGDQTGQAGKLPQADQPPFTSETTSTTTSSTSSTSTSPKDASTTSTSTSNLTSPDLPSTTSPQDAPLTTTSPSPPSSTKPTEPQKPTTDTTTHPTEKTSPKPKKRGRKRPKKKTPMYPPDDVPEARIRFVDAVEVGIMLRG